MNQLTVDCSDFPQFCDNKADTLALALNPLLVELSIKGTVTIKIGDESESHYLNLRYRGKDNATDVLSFILNDSLPDGSLYCGDIHICHPIAQRQAQEAGHSLYREILILSLHGLLHLAGYDHETDNGEMISIQESLLARFPPR